MYKLGFAIEPAGVSEGGIRAPDHAPANTCVHT